MPHTEDEEKRKKEVKYASTKRQASSSTIIHKQEPCYCSAGTMQRAAVLQRGEGKCREGIGRKPKEQGVDRVQLFLCECMCVCVWNLFASPRLLHTTSRRC